MVFKRCLDLHDRLFPDWSVAKLGGWGERERQCSGFCIKFYLCFFKLWNYAFLIFLVLKYPFSYDKMVRAAEGAQHSSPTQVHFLGNFTGLRNLNPCNHCATWSLRSLSAPKLNVLWFRIALRKTWIFFLLQILNKDFCHALECDYLCLLFFSRMVPIGKGEGFHWGKGKEGSTFAMGTGSLRGLVVTPGSASGSICVGSAVRKDGVLISSRNSWCLEVHGGKQQEGKYAICQEETGPSRRSKARPPSSRSGCIGSLVREFAVHENRSEVGLFPWSHGGRLVNSAEADDLNRDSKAQVRLPQSGWYRIETIESL